MRIKLICSKFEDFEPSPSFRPSLCFADPPDNVGRKYENYGDRLSNGDYVAMLDKWLTSMNEITDGPIFLSFAEKWISDVEAILRNRGIKIIQRIVWYYTFGQASRSRYSPCFRPIYWLKDPRIYPAEILVPSARQEMYNDTRAAADGKMPNNVWKIPRICGTFKEKRKWHCTQHPEALLKRIILGHSKEGDTVFDPFIGSGTTAYVCAETGRDCVGMDVSEFYLQKIREELVNRNEGDGVV